METLKINSYRNGSAWGTLGSPQKKKMSCRSGGERRYDPIAKLYQCYSAVYLVCGHAYIAIPKYGIIYSANDREWIKSLRSVVGTKFHKIPIEH